MERYKTIMEIFNVDEKRAKYLDYNIENVKNLYKILIPLGLIFYILGGIKEFILINILMYLTRKNIGGIHFKESLKCFLVSLIAVVIIYYGSMWYINIGLRFIIYAFIVLIWFKYIPKGTYLLPLTNIERIKKMRFNSLIIIVITILLDILYNGVFIDILLLTLTLSTLLVTPLVYKLFKVKEFREK